MKDELSYLAGIFDGEGSITVPVFHDRSGDNYMVAIAVVMTDERIPAKFRDYFGGKLYTYTVKNTKRPVFAWHATGKHALECLAILGPYLIVRSKQAKLALTFPLLSRGTKMSPEVRKTRSEIRTRMRELNAGVIG